MSDLAAKKAEMERALAELQRQIDDTADQDTKELRAWLVKVNTALAGRSLHGVNVVDTAIVVRAILQMEGLLRGSETSDKTAVSVQR